MKNILCIATLLIIMLFASNTANAQGAYMGGGFKGPSLSVSTVSIAKTMRDGTAVVLQGNIEKSLGNEKYLFRDNTGVIIIEIDNDKWLGVTVTPKNKIEITGEVDKDLASIEIDVKSLKIK